MLYFSELMIELYVCERGSGNDVRVCHQFGQLSATNN